MPKAVPILVKDIDKTAMPKSHNIYRKLTSTVAVMLSFICI
jgi:hypothetical protein